MKQEGLKERMELLDIGEKLGWPRLGYRRSTKIPHDGRIPAGKDEWEKFAGHAHVRRVLPALRVGRVLRDNNVEVFHPLSGAETRPRSSDGQEHPVGNREVADSTSAVGSPASDLLEDIVVPRWTLPGTVAVYPPGKRRRQPSKKNRAKANG